MDKANLSRRGFLERSLAALVAGAGLPVWYAREVLADEDARAVPAKGRSANGRIQLGVIGSGDRSHALVEDAGRHQDFVVVAACDVDRKHRENMARIAGKHYTLDCAQYADFRELCGRKDIDAVIVATPDHWHALTAIAAMKSGKDVYGEKPLALTIAEGQAMVKVARQMDRVYQVGSQQRSDARFRLACELVRNGRIGKVKRVETRVGDCDTSPSLPVVPVPEGLDWDFWLGPAPQVEYVSKPRPKKKYPYSRCHYEFRWWYDYSGGKMTDWGAHHNDIAQWGLGRDGSGPIAVEAEGQEPSREPNSYTCHPRFTITYKYDNGTKLVCTSDGENGIHFEGEHGKWIFVSRSTIRASDQKLIDEPLPKDAVRLYVSHDHMGNFRDCVRSRKRPICDVEIGHRSVSVCHLGVIALRTGKKLRWDPVGERFLDDEQANTWLSREMRAPWKLEV